MAGAAQPPAAETSWHATAVCRYDSATVIAQVAYFDNSAVVVSSVTPVASPISGASTLTLQGTGFLDLEGAACILNVAGTEQIRVPAVVSTDGSQVTCSPDEQQRTIGSFSAVSIGVVLNGDIATLRLAAQAVYFVDLTAVRISRAHPAAGPIRGGTTILIAGQGLRVCGGTVCPEPPICVFELRTPMPGVVATTLQASLASPYIPANAGAGAGATGPSPTLPARNVTVIGVVRRRGGVNVLQCEAPSSGLTTEDATELRLSESVLGVRIRIGLLGYIAPNTVLADIPSFQYYDAAVHSVTPHGGPLLGDTRVTLRGRGLNGQYTGGLFYPEGGYPKLDNRVLCVFLASPPPPYGSSSAGNGVVLTSPATALSDGQLTCASPRPPGSAVSSGGATTFYIEAALNGYVDERTALTVRLPPRFTYYNAAVSRLEPLGGPAVGATAITVHGSNLADYGGLRCLFTFAAAPPAGQVTVPDVVTNATVIGGSGISGGAIRCASPSLNAPRLDAIGGSLPASVGLRLVLNGQVRIVQRACSLIDCLRACKLPTASQRAYETCAWRICCCLLACPRTRFEPRNAT